MTVVNKPRIMISVAAVAAVTALGGVGAASSTAAPTEPDSDAAATLMGMLPAGYDSSNCSPPDQDLDGSLVTLDCGQNSLPNGPTAARFALFSDPQTMDSKFDIFVSEDQLSPCPNGGASPGTWSYNANSEDVAGQIACGTYQGTPDIVWTQNAELMLGNIGGEDLNSLYEYWSHPNGPSAAPANQR